MNYLLYNSHSSVSALRSKLEKTEGEVCVKSDHVVALTRELEEVRAEGENLRGHWKVSIAVV